MSIKFVYFLFYFISMLILSGCSAVDSHGDSLVKDAVLGSNADVLRRARKDGAMAAYDRARTSMLREKRVHVDVLWVLYQFADSDAELKAFIEESKKSILAPYFIPGVFSDLPRMELPEHPDRGIRKFILYLQAAFSQPQDRALSWLQKFIASEEEGYILTHQFLGLIWAEQANLPLTEEMLVRKQELWHCIYEEQCSVAGVNSIDLYMERIAMVLMYGYPEGVDRRVVDRWMAQIVDLQLDDGSWPLSKTRISYDEAFTVVSSPRSHTTALAMMALNAYIQK